MSHEHEQPEELKAVEQSLAAFAPAAPRLDRDRLMFLAGAASASASAPASAQASGRREPPDGHESPGGQTIGQLTLPARLLWPVTSAALAATSLALAVVLVTRPTPPSQVVYLAPPAAEVPHRAIPTAPTVARHQPQIDPASPILASRQSASSVPAENYVRTREVALRLGLDALGDLSGGGSGSGSPTPTYRSLLESLTPAVQGRTDAASESSQM
jgi:hypothetical protein